MASVIVEVNISVDGEPIRGFPLTRRLAVDEIQTANPYEVATGGGFVDLPISQVGTIQYLLVEPDQATTYQFADGAAGNIALNANGLILIVNGNLTATPEVDNSSGNTAKIKVQAGGT